jgi:hypothetical protein
MMNLFTAFFYSAFFGFLALSVMLRRITLQNRGLFFLASSFPVGAGLCSLVLFISHLVWAPGAKFLSLALSVAAMTLLLGYRITRPAPEPASSGNLHLPWKDKSMLGGMIPPFLSFLLFAVTFVTVLEYYSLAAPMELYGGGDVRYFWALKAKFFFRAPEEWLNMFSPKLFWSHTDYPLLMPAIRAWGWNWLGYESLLWPPVVSIGFYVSCVFLLIWYLSSYVSWTSGWMGGTFFLILTPYLYWTIWQYADTPLTFFITACGLTLVAALRSEQKKLFVLSGLFGGLSAWTKNEGLFFILWVYMILGGICLMRRRKKTAGSFAPLLHFTGGALLPLAAVGILKGFLGTHGDYLGSGRGLQEYREMIFAGWEKTLTILKAFYAFMAPFKEWRGLWGFFVAATLAGGILWKKHRNDFTWILFLLVLLTNLGYLFIFHITPHDLAWHLKFSLDRLIIHSGGLAVAFIFEILTFTRKKA